MSEPPFILIRSRLYHLDDLFHSRKILFAAFRAINNAIVCLYAFTRTVGVKAALALDLHENHLLFNYTEYSEYTQAIIPRLDPEL